MRRRKGKGDGKGHGILWLGAGVLLVSSVACGGKKSEPTKITTPAGNYTVTLTATSSGSTVSTTTLTIQVK